MKGCKRTTEARGKAVPAEASLRDAWDSDATVPKHIGFEIELGNHLAQEVRDDNAAEAAAALVAAHHRQYRGQTDRGDQSVSEFDELGFRFYLDHEHAEISSPLAPSPKQLVLVLREARQMVNACTQAAAKEVGPLRVSYNNTNRQGVAWAFHTNVLVSRTAFNQWREADWSPLQRQWIPFLVTSLPLMGTGKVGAENGARDTAFQFSQRADFIDGTVGVDTVGSKTLINTRDEPLADPERFARLHVIAFDTNLTEFANWLKFGISQVLLALLEDGAPMPNLALDNPVHAMRAVSRDLKFRKRLRLRNGRRETALGMQRRLAEAAARAIETGCAASQVPEATLIVRQWIETIDALEARDARLKRRLDWCAKLDMLRRAQALGTTDRRRLLMLDLHYAELGGLFDKLEQTACVDRLEDFLPRGSVASNRPQLVLREEVRALLVSRFGRHLDRVDWDHAASRDEAGRLWVIPMEDPLDGWELLRVVRSAEDWPSCLRRLIEMNLAQAVAVCAVVCESHDRSAEQIAEALFVRERRNKTS